MSDSNSTNREGTVMSLRVTSEDVDALDEVREALRPLGFELTRHGAARAALRRGLAAMRSDSIQREGAPH